MLYNLVQSAYNERSLFEHLSLDAIKFKANSGQVWGIEWQMFKQ